MLRPLMCGRYVLATPTAEVAAALSASTDIELPSNWNVAPSQSVPVVQLSGDGARDVSRATWGIEAPWSERGRVINARSESIAEKRMFARLLTDGRCAVPMDGWYEWRRHAGTGRDAKTPFFIRPRRGTAYDHGGIAVALGLVDRSASSMVVLTRTPGPELAAIHDRMPLLADAELVAAWLDGTAGPPSLLGPPPPDDALEWWEVGREVNSARSSGPRLVEPPGRTNLFD